MLFGTLIWSYLKIRKLFPLYTSEKTFSSLSYCGSLSVDHLICLGSYLKSAMVYIVSPLALENVIVLSLPTVIRMPWLFQSAATIFLECLFTHGIFLLAILD